MEVAACFVENPALAVAACESTALMAAACWAEEALAKVAADFLEEEEAQENAMEQPGKVAEQIVEVSMNQEHAVQAFLAVD